MVGKARALLLTAAFLPLAACGNAPSSICGLSANEHFWQGLSVDWQGEIVDIMAWPHGGGVYFTDRHCFQKVELDRETVPILYKGGDPWMHGAIATFRVKGRLIYRNGEIVLKPTELRRLTSWKTDEDDQFFRYLDELRAERALNMKRN